MKPLAPMREPQDAFMKPNVFAHQNRAENGCIWLAVAPSVSLEAEHAPAKATTVSREPSAAPVAAAGPSRSTGACRQDQCEPHSTAGAAGVEGAG